ncbi:MAG: hypothetical protein ACLU7D_06410 [Collinsella sp.]
MEVIILPITSMAPVRTHRLYVNYRARTNYEHDGPQGHQKALERGRGYLPPAWHTTTCCKGEHARKNKRTDMAAFQAGHLKHSSITTSQMIGTRASKNAATSMGRNSPGTAQEAPSGGHKKTSTGYRTFTDKLQPPAEIIEQPVQKHERAPPRLY